MAYFCLSVRKQSRFPSSLKTMHNFHHFLLFRMNLSTIQSKLNQCNPQMHFLAREEQLYFKSVLSVLSHKANLVSPKYRTFLFYFYGMRNSLPGIS